jgi:MFS family permease
VSEPPPPTARSRASSDPLAAVEPERGHRLRRLSLVDVGPLRRSRDFRLLFMGQAVSFTGSMVTYVALPFQFYRLTHSSLQVGLLGVAELVPLLATALIGGAVADAFDRRRTALMTEVAAVVLTTVLLVNATLRHPRVWPLYVVSALFAAVDGLQRPSLEALLPRVVSRADLPVAIALASLRMNVGLVAGPPLGGLLIALGGLSAAYTVDLVSFSASLVALASMRAMPPPPDAARPSLRGIADGWHFARSRPVLLGTYLVDINAMLFGMPKSGARRSSGSDLHRRCGSPSYSSLLPVQPTPSAGCSGRASGTRRCRTSCAAGSPASRC